LRYAINNDKQRVEVSESGELALCPCCSKPVKGRRGDHRIHHWYHYEGLSSNCDGWYEPMTEWHLKWQNYFPSQNQEVVITKDGEKHIADIKTSTGVILEFQNSSINSNVIRKREKFYGQKLVWIINALPFKKNLLLEQSVLWSKGDPYVYKWNRPRRSWEVSIRPIFLDFGPDWDELFWVKKGMGTRSLEGIYYNKKKFIERNGGDLI